MQRRLVVTDVSGQPKVQSSRVQEEFLVHTELSDKANPSDGTWYLWALNLEMRDEQSVFRHVLRSDYIYGMFVALREVSQCGSSEDISVSRGAQLSPPERWTLPN